MEAAKGSKAFYSSNPSWKIISHTHTHLQSGILKSFADLPIVSATCVAIIHQNRRRHSPYTPLPTTVKDLVLQTILKAFDVAANCVARAWPRPPFPAQPTMPFYAALTTFPRGFQVFVAAKTTPD